LGNQANTLVFILSTSYPPRVTGTTSYPTRQRKGPSISGKLPLVYDFAIAYNSKHSHQLQDGRSKQSLPEPIPPPAPPLAHLLPRYLPLLQHSCQILDPDPTTHRLETAWFLFFAWLSAGRTPSLAKSNAQYTLVLICLVAFTIELWNLHLIVESEGEGNVWGRRVPEGAFSLFMFWITVCHVIFVGMEVTGIAFYIDAQGTFITESILIAIIVLAGWAANRDGVDGNLTLA
jgi:hypothetical protein